MSEVKTVREQVSEVLGTINANFKELTASDCSEYASKLAALLPNILDKEAESEGICTMYKVTLLDDEDNMSVSEADVRMKATQEYLDYKKIRALRIGVEETLRALKRRIDVKTREEYEHQL